MQLAVKYNTFISNLESAFEMLGPVFPAYDCLRRLADGRNGSEAPTEATKVLQVSIENVYVDLLELLHSVIRLFFKEDGGKYSELSIYRLASGLLVSQEYGGSFSYSHDWCGHHLRQHSRTRLKR